MHQRGQPAALPRRNAGARDRHPHRGGSDAVDALCGSCSPKACCWRAWGALWVPALGYWILPLVASALPQHTTFFTRVHDAGFEINSTVLIFTVLLSVLSYALCGLLPAWRTTRPARISGASVRTGRIRGALIGLEVALSFVLLAGAGLMMKSLVRLLEIGRRVPDGTVTDHGRKSGG